MKTKLSGKCFLEIKKVENNLFLSVMKGRAVILELCDNAINLVFRSEHIPNMDYATLSCDRKNILCIDTSGKCLLFEMGNAVPYRKILLHNAQCISDDKNLYFIYNDKKTQKQSFKAIDICTGDFIPISFDNDEIHSIFCVGEKFYFLSGSDFEYDNGSYKSVIYVGRRENYIIVVEKEIYVDCFTGKMIPCSSPCLFILEAFSCSDTNYYLFDTCNDTLEYLFSCRDFEKCKIPFSAPTDIRTNENGDLCAVISPWSLLVFDLSDKKLIYETEIEYASGVEWVDDGTLLVASWKGLYKIDLK